MILLVFIWPDTSKGLIWPGDPIFEANRGQNLANTPKLNAKIKCKARPLKKGTRAHGRMATSTHGIMGSRAHLPMGSFRAFALGMIHIFLLF